MADLMQCQMTPRMAEAIYNMLRLRFCTLDGYPIVDHKWITIQAKSGERDQARIVTCNRMVDV